MASVAGVGVWWRWWFCHMSSPEVKPKGGFGCEADREGWRWKVMKVEVERVAWWMMKQVVRWSEG